MSEIKLPFSEEDIRNAFAESTIEKGLSYFGEDRVYKININNGHAITAQVRGTVRKAYKIDIAFGRNPRTNSPVIIGRCTCPLGYNCKHVVAVLYEALDMVDRVALARQRETSRRETGKPSLPQLPAPEPGIERVTDISLDFALGRWLENLEREGRALESPPEVTDYLLYLLRFRTQAANKIPEVQAVVARRLKNGGFSSGRVVMFDRLLISSAQYVRPDDQVIIALFRNPHGYYQANGSLPDSRDMCDLVLRRLIATGRCFWEHTKSPPLKLGEPCPGSLVWSENEQEQQSLELRLERSEGTHILLGAQPWYVDTVRGEAGPIKLDIPSGLLKAMLSAPPVAKAQAVAVRAALAQRVPQVPLPMPRISQHEERVEIQPVPALYLFTGNSQGISYTRSRWGAIETVTHDLMCFAFDYQGLIVRAGDLQPELRWKQNGRLFVCNRQRDFEEQCRQRLLEAGFGPGTAPAGIADLPEHFDVWQTADTASWPHFLYRLVPDLQAEGWRVLLAPAFRHRVIDAVGEDWQADVQEGDPAVAGDAVGSWWFSLDLGITVEGQRVALLPVLMDILRRIPDPSAPGALEAMARDGVVYGQLADGRALALPFARVRAILTTLVELFDSNALNTEGRLDISLGQALGLAELESSLQLRWLGGERLQRLAKRLASFSGVAEVTVPEGFLADLRPYQHEGLNWLQFLRDYELGGILADDMGLGKTVQTLAHILSEKQAGRLTNPCLVVSPTSVLPNWRAEVARFAPTLSVLALHGPGRAESFNDISRSDLVLTTYPLLVRDADRLLSQTWHIVVLDEAQMIKNPTAKVTQIVCKIKAAHRLCLTGTPVENHLGELWSQFTFLMPGVLGDHRRFTRVFRSPIEKKSDDERRGLLAARVRPFILRRTKQQVAAELPPKTEILQRIELAGEQRDLYETVRLAMHEKVQEAVRNKGLARSHIIILDALLKLRQVCCDPRLVKLTAARKVKSSAKLSALLEMVPELIEDGRRILLFSQFTSMLDLIVTELRTVDIPFVELRGDTTDRATPVARFQNGEVPLFLISLKAGGTGLNLTAADTVIHYDPWWNPAVENQATDRAHRLGQDKPVFVYKLIAEGTIEERMLDLQQRKQALADALFDPGRAKGGTSFDQSDLELLFQPLT